MTTADPLQGAIEAFWDTIPPVWNQVRGNARSIAVNECQITLLQFHILRQVRKGAGSVSELAELQQISRPAISQAVDALVEGGFLTRRQDSGDRRYVHLELTAKSQKLLDAIFRKNREWMAEKMKNLKAPDLQTVVQALSILHEAFISRGE